MKLSIWIIVGAISGMGFPSITYSQETLTAVTTKTYALLDDKKAVYLDYPSSKATLYQITLADKSKKVLVPEGTGPNSTLYFMYFGVSGDHLAYIPFSTQPKPTYPLNYVNLATGAKKKLTADEGWKETVEVGGNIAVWIDFRHKTAGDKNSEIYLHNLSTGAEKRITTSVSYQTKAVTDGKHVAWVDYANGNKGIVVLHDIATGKDFPLGDGTSHQDNPRVSGDFVVWEDYRNATSDTTNADIYAYNIKTKETLGICVKPGFQGTPYISGNAVVWEDHRNAGNTPGNADIYAYDLVDGKEYQVTQGLGFEGSPVVYGNKVVWLGIEGSVMSLYLGSVSFGNTSVKQTRPDFFQSGKNSGSEVYRLDGRAVTGPMQKFHPAYFSPWVK